MDSKHIAHQSESLSRVEWGHNQLELPILQMSQVKKVINEALGQLELRNGKLNVPHGLILVLCRTMKLLDEGHNALDEVENRG